jgi:hypothetical protein
MARLNIVNDAIKELYFIYLLLDFRPVESYIA